MTNKERIERLKEQVNAEPLDYDFLKDEGKPILRKVPDISFKTNITSKCVFMEPEDWDWIISQLEKLEEAMK